MIVELETTEQKGLLADGVEYTFWTFGGTVPGPMLRVREGDTVEIRLTNRKDSHLMHSIDLHALTGPGGGAAVTQVMPGETGAFAWNALNPRTLRLPLRDAPRPDAHRQRHVRDDPRRAREGTAPGRPRVLRHAGRVLHGRAHADAGARPLRHGKARDERPEYVVFNGRMGALLDKTALTATAGDTVRLYVGNGGPNLISSFHILGEVFDRVWSEAAFPGEPKRNVQTTLVPAGGAATVVFSVDVPGRFLLVDHSISRAMDKSALGALVVTGEGRPGVFKALTPGIANRGSGD